MFRIKSNKVLVFTFFFLAKYCLGALTREDSDRIINEIDRGMKENLGLVKSAQGVTHHTHENYSNQHYFDGTWEWTLKGDQMKVFERASTHYIFSNPTDMTYHNYLYSDSNGGAWDIHLPDTKYPSFNISTSEYHRGRTNVIHPFERFTFGGRCIKEYSNYCLKRNWEFKLTGTDIVDDDPCYVFERITPSVDSTKEISRFFIDPLKGYGIVKILSRFDEGKPTVISNFEYTTIKDPKSKRLFWYLKHYTQNIYDMKNRTKLVDKVEESVSITKINQKVSDRDIDYFWKPGVIVRFVDLESNSNDNSMYSIQKPAFTEDILSGKVSLVPYKSK